MAISTVILTTPHSRAAGFIITLLVCCLAFPVQALEINQLSQEVSLILNHSSIGGDDAEYAPMYGNEDKGPVMTSDDRVNGAGFQKMAAYLNFDGVGAIEAQFNDITNGHRNSSFFEYFKRVINDGSEPVDLRLIVNIVPGIIRIDNGGGTLDLPMRASKNFDVVVSDPEFSFSQPTKNLWSHAVELVGPVDSAGAATITSNDPLGLGLPSVERTTGIDWVAENIGGKHLVIPLGVLEPGQDIAFVCKASVHVIGNTNGGHAKLGDPWDFINGTGDPQGTSFALAEFVEGVFADSFEEPETE